MKLSDIRCKNARVKESAYKITDGDGMYLLIHPNGSRYFRLDYSFHDRRKTLALGVYPEMSLQEAREERRTARKQLSKGIDPALKRLEKKLLKRIEQRNDFETVAREWHSKQLSKWTPRYAKQVLSVLERDLFPDIGKLPVKDVSAVLLLAALRKVEARGALDALKDTRAHAGRVFRYAIATGRAERDVAADLQDAFEVHVARVNPYLLETEMPEFLRAVSSYSGEKMTRLALKLMLLTFVRTTELRFARWAEFDVDRAEWRIPAERMKMRRPHIVPLAKQTIGVLEEMREISGHSEYLLPYNGKKSEVISENRLLYALYKMGYKGKLTVHGLRGTASTILNESQLFMPDAIERQLAHVPGNGVRAAYNHAQYLVERREMMQWWADHLDELAARHHPTVGLSCRTRRNEEESAIMT